MAPYNGPNDPILDWLHVTSIAGPAARISAASASQMPSALARVLAEDQRGWRERGELDGIVGRGERIDDFTLPDATGSPVTLGEIVADGPAVVVFYRGGWCPYCNLALRTYQAELLPELADYGARLVAISPQSPDQSLSTSEQAGLSFTVLSDPGAALAYRFGIGFTPAPEVLRAQRALGQDLTQVNATVDLPLPTVLIIDSDRTVRFVDPCADYTTRTEVHAILGALERLGGVGNTPAPAISGGAR
jgi:peroxiredoxin